MDTCEPDPPRLTEAECLALMQRMFPAGFAGPDVLAELAPEGWEFSPLVRAFHPTLEQWHAERVAQHRHFEKLKQTWHRNRPKEETKPPVPASPGEPTLEDSRSEFRETPVDALSECTELVGAACWEIFSSNHTVVASDGREVDLGSWRASSAFLDAFASHGADPDRWHDGDDMRFYMGHCWIHERCDCGPAYRMDFRRLQHEQCDWIYSFPRLHFVRFDRDEAAGSEAHDYDPSTAFARAQERTEEDAEHARIDAERERLHEEDRAEARRSPPPAVVLAYQSVYTRWPDGWPP